MRIASLIPSATEIICALGAGEQLVGVSHECDYPPTALAGLPALSRAKLPEDASSLEIDRTVRDIVAKSLSVYEIDAEKLKDLRAEIIFTQDHCEVCAVSKGELQKALEAWTQDKPRIVSFSPNRLEDIWRDILEAGERLGREAQASDLTASLQDRLAAMAKRVASEKIAKPPKVIALEWLQPVMSCGSWSPQITALLGGEEMLGRVGEKARYESAESIAAAEPDFLLITLCGFDVERSLEDWRALENQSPWRELRDQGRVYVCNGNHFFNRPGPRIVDSAEIMAEILHPDLFDFGHRGRNFIRIE